MTPRYARLGKVRSPQVPRLVGPHTNGLRPGGRRAAALVAVVKAAPLARPPCDRPPPRLRLALAQTARRARPVRRERGGGLPAPWPVDHGPSTRAGQGR